MTNHSRRFACRFIIRSVCLALVLLTSALSFAQMESATMSGTVMDRSGAVVADTKIEVTNSDTNVKTTTTTNKSGTYVVTGLRPGRYRMAVSKEGFRSIAVTDITLNVQDTVSRNFNLDVGAFSESITVTADQTNINTTDATVSTVVDRNFAENLPMNGRSFQTLIELTPGVVVTTTNPNDNGQFSVNGQRASSNYWMVDGVSANIGVSAGVPSGNGLGGSLGAFSALGGTNSLVSVDALQEFRIQTSTYAPEFGRTPGGQISIVTRSGTNQFHGTAFDYFRNDVLDANNWFNGYTNSPPLPKAEERQNDFGGTFNGPILKNRTFFFFSYEGFRLRLPQTTLTTVPDASFTPGTTNSRQSAISAMQPFLNAFPLPNPSSPEILCDPNTDPNCPASGPSSGKTGTAAFNASHSNPATLDAYSLRVDHKLTEKLALLGRYDYSPSEIDLRGNGGALSAVSVLGITVQTGTVGATWTPSRAIVDELRFNYSRSDSSSHQFLDSFGGAIPLTSLPFPSPFTNRDANFGLIIASLKQGGIATGQIVDNLQRQLNIVNNLSMQRGSHNLKFGVDFRRLSPVYDPAKYGQFPDFNNIADAEAGNATGFNNIIANNGATFLFRNLGFFAQDTWRIIPRLTLTYGVRWDIEFVPKSLNGPSLPAVTGFDLNNFSNLALAPAGTLPYKTTYGNFAPRLGIAYQLTQSQNWQTVLRGGFGAFYDLASQEIGNNLLNQYPFGAIKRPAAAAPFPFDAATAAPPIISPSNTNVIFAIDPRLKQPYTLQWNVALEQALGNQQTLSGSYIGAAGRRLLQSALVIAANSNFPAAAFTSNLGRSDYHAFQLQFQRRFSHGLAALASYSWSHSIDTGSASSAFGNLANAFLPGVVNSNRGPSDFDIRNAFSAGVTYDVPAPSINAFTNAVLRGWSIQSSIQAHSALPVDISDGNFFDVFSNFALGDIRPDVVPGQPFYLHGSQYPGGKAFNPAAFTDPPTDPSTGFTPLRQGTASRNLLRGFGATQWDFAVHRDFPIRESVKLQFRAEMFNILNHPNFAPPKGCIGFFTCLTTGPFGLSQEILSNYLGGSVGSGGFSSLYQLGGPRSIQLALKLNF